MVFYDRTGKAIAYTEDKEHIYLFNGSPVAFFKNDVVYNFRGKQLGRYNNGWIRDLNGRCVFFTETASGSAPIKPVTKIMPVKSVKRIQPIKAVTQIPRIKAVDSLSWSEYSGELFFQ